MQHMSFDDPEYLECTCTNRALREEEKVTYLVPRKAGDEQVWLKLVFAKDCPVHGYTVNHTEKTED